MSVLFWVLVAITWFPAGYVASRLRSAIFGHDVEHGRFEKCSCTTFDWNRAVTSDSERKLFALAFLSSWIALTIILLIVAVGVLTWLGNELFVEGLLKELGERIAPKPK